MPLFLKRQCDRTLGGPAAVHGADHDLLLHLSRRTYDVRTRHLLRDSHRTAATPRLVLGRVSRYHTSGLHYYSK